MRRDAFSYRSSTSHWLIQLAYPKMISTRLFAQCLTYISGDSGIHGFIDFYSDFPIEKSHKCRKYTLIGIIHCCFGVFLYTFSPLRHRLPMHWKDWNHPWLAVSGASNIHILIPFYFLRAALLGEHCWYDEFTGDELVQENCIYILVVIGLEQAGSIWDGSHQPNISDLPRLGFGMYICFISIQPGITVNSNRAPLSSASISPNGIMSTFTLGVLLIKEWSTWLKHIRDPPVPISGLPHSTPKVMCLACPSPSSHYIAR